MRDPGGGDDLVTQFEMKGVEDFGLAKFDFLGLKTTTIINAAVQHVRASSPELANLDILDIPFEVPAIIEMLNAGYRGRKSVDKGKGVTVRVDLGGGRVIKKNPTQTQT